MFNIIRRIGTITRRIQMDSNQNFKAIGLNNNLFIYIIRVCEKPGMFLAELADSIQFDRSTSFRTVQKLVRQGYLEIQKDKQNQKIKRIFPTQKAKAIYPQLHAYEKEQSNKLLAPLSKQEQEQLTYLLNKLDS